MPDRIIFAGDFLRPGPRGEENWQNGFIRYFFLLLAPSIRAASGRPVTLLQTGADGLRQGQIFEGLGQPFDHPTWISLYTGTAGINVSVANVMRPVFDGALVVGFELPAAVRSWFEAENIAYLDVSICPLQFMEDAALSMRASHVEIGRRLQDYHLSETAIETFAGIAQTAILAGEPAPPEMELDDAVLFCASTATDRNMILHGRYGSYADFEEVVSAACASHAHVLFKAHPWGTGPEGDAALFARFPNVRETTTNVYTLMTRMKGLKRVISLCSSASLEAPYFGVDGVNLIRPPLLMLRDGHANDLAEGRYVTVLHDFWRVSFWADVLEPLFGRPTRLPRDMPVRPHRLRNALNMYGPSAVIELTPGQRGLDLHRASTNS